MCYDIGVHTDAKKIRIKTPCDLETFDDLSLESLEDSLETPHDFVWIVPLFSWYATPSDDREHSLYVSYPSEDVEKTKAVWMDNRMCVWPENPKFSPAKYFADLCKDRVKTYDAPVISFSHFLPLRQLCKPDEDDIERVESNRSRLGLCKEFPPYQGALAGFNFTMYAGCSYLEHQIRQMHSKVHVFGHQHRNRDRMVDGVRYISHCLGYKREVQQGLMYGIEDGLKQIWP